MKNLVNVINDARDNGYTVFGIRTIEKEAGFLNVGDTCPDSYDWDVENDCSTRETTGKTLNGACAVEINFSEWADAEEIQNAIENTLEAASAYFGEQKVLITGKYYEYGYDECANGLHEIIIEDATVLAIVE